MVVLTLALYVMGAPVDQVVPEVQLNEGLLDGRWCDLPYSFKPSCTMPTGCKQTGFGSCAGKCKDAPDSCCLAPDVAVANREYHSANCAGAKEKEMNLGAFNPKLPCPPKSVMAAREQAALAASWKTAEDNVKVALGEMNATQATAGPTSSGSTQLGTSSVFLVTAAVTTAHIAGLV